MTELKKELKEPTEFEKKFNEKDYKKQTYTFSKEEATRLISLDSTIQTAILTQRSAENLVNTIINNVCLSRVGVKNSPDVAVQYDLVAGNFYVFVPRILCDMCKNRKAVYDKENQHLCDACMKIVEVSKSK